MGNGITGAPQNFLNMANKVQNTGVFGAEYNDTIVAEKGKPLHGHSEGIFSKMRDVFNAKFRPDTHAKNLQDRQDAIKGGAQKIFDAMKRDYGETFAKAAFTAVGSGHAAGDNQPYSADRVTGGQLLQLQNIAHKFDNFMEKEFKPEVLLGQARLHDITSIKLHDGATQEAGGNPLPDDHPDVAAFRKEAAVVFDTFIKVNAKYEINISHNVRKKFTRDCGDESANFATMSTADLIKMQKHFKSAQNQNVHLLSNEVGRFTIEGPGKDAFETPMEATWAAGQENENAGLTFTQRFANEEAERLKQQAAPPSRPAPTPEEYAASHPPSYDEATREDALPLHTDFNADPVYLDAHSATTAKPTSTVSVNVTDEVEDTENDLPPKRQDVTMTAEELNLMNSKTER
ncbi:MAG: hypothetical protein AAFR47_22660 [Pseudomonadota bacterium]